MVRLYWVYPLLHPRSLPWTHPHHIRHRSPGIKGDGDGDGDDEQMTGDGDETALDSCVICASVANTDYESSSREGASLK
jgi:hypothetical protein